MCEKKRNINISVFIHQQYVKIYMLNFGKGDFILHLVQSQVSQNIKNSL